MTSFSLLTICGLPDLHLHADRRVTHVLSLLDPDWPAPEAFQRYDPHHRQTVNFHDVIEAVPGTVSPTLQHVEAILDFGRQLRESQDDGRPVHLLVHCHVGISRSTAAMALLLAQMEPDLDEDAIFARIREIRPQAWPNCNMIAFGDKLLKREGRLTAALGRHYAKQLSDNPALEEAQRANGRAREVDFGLSSRDLVRS